MDRRNGTTQQTFVTDWGRSAWATARALTTPDGRWALVSTSLTVVIATAIAWMAAGTVPAVNSRGFEVGQRSLMPYQLFLELTQSGHHTNDAGPGYASPSTHPQATPFDKALAAERTGDNGSTGMETRTITLDSGDTLVGALEDAGVSNDDATAALAALTKVFNSRGLRTGQSFALTLSNLPDGTVAPISNLALPVSVRRTQTTSGATLIEIPAAPAATPAAANKLVSIVFSPSVEHDITVMRGANGSFTAQDVQKKLVAHVHRAGATINSSLYLAAMQAGIPADVVVEMIRMFSYKVDFQRDLHPGDSFQVFYNYYYTPDGRPAKEGDVKYAQMTLSGKTIALYSYQPDPNEPADYFDAHGQSAKGMLMKTPVDGARITSGFGMRFHPILGYTRMHKGIDFGVPIGTPVMAAGAGTIEFMGVQNGYGNFVILNHGGGYETAYGHLSRFAAGMHRGGHVRQGQVFAYSGMSGMATGPHLHYEIRINKVQVNPAKVKVAQGRKLLARDLRDFLAERLRVDALLASMPLETKVADVAADLRQAKSQ